MLASSLDLEITDVISITREMELQGGLPCGPSGFSGGGAKVKLCYDGRSLINGLHSTDGEIGKHRGQVFQFCLYVCWTNARERAPVSCPYGTRSPLAVTLTGHILANHC